MKDIKELLEFGFINLDKPSGPTSFSVGQFVKERLGLRKTSHLGTLDPQVSGVLPIALNRACKLNEFFMHRNKTYVGIMRLHEDVEDKILNKELKKFIGVIIQLPPKRSRVKRQEREREVVSFDITEREGKNVLFRTEVQAGTYIRKLIHDLGEKIGGAHMLELRRTQAGIFEEPCINLYDFEKALYNEDDLRKMIISAEEALEKVMPIVKVKKKAVNGLLTGKPLMQDDLLGKLPGDDRFAVFYGGKFIEVVRKVDEPGIIARALFVFN